MAISESRNRKQARNPTNHGCPVIYGINAHDTGLKWVRLSAAVKAIPLKL